MSYSLYLAPNVFSKEKAKKETFSSWEEVISFFRAFCGKSVSEKNILPAMWQNINNDGADFIILDYDSLPKGSLSKFYQKVKKLNLSCIIYTTASNQTKGLDCFRVVVPLKRPIKKPNSTVAGSSLTIFAAVTVAFSQLFPKEFIYDRTCEQWNRGMFLPSIVAGNKCVMHSITGELFDWETDNAKGKILKEAKSKPSLTEVKSRKVYVKNEEDENINLTTFWDRNKETIDLEEAIKPYVDVFGPRPSGKTGLHIRCPNEHNHGHPKENDPACFVDNHAEGRGYARIHCLHNACRELRTVDFLELLMSEKENPSRVDRMPFSALTQNTLERELVEASKLSLADTASDSIKKQVELLDQNDDRAYWDETGFNPVTTVDILRDVIFISKKTDKKLKEFVKKNKKFIEEYKTTEVIESSHVREAKLNKLKYKKEKLCRILSNTPPKNDKEKLKKIYARGLIDEVYSIIDTSLATTTVANDILRLSKIYGFSPLEMRTIFSRVMEKHIYEYWEPSSSKSVRAKQARVLRDYLDNWIHLSAKSTDKLQSVLYMYAKRDDSINVIDYQHVINQIQMKKMLGERKWRKTSPFPVDCDDQLQLFDILRLYPLLDPEYKRFVCSPVENKKPEDFLLNEYNTFDLYSLDGYEKIDKKQQKQFEDKFLIPFKTVLADDDDEKWDIILTFFSHIVQKPWDKPDVFLFFTGQQGTGKSAMINALLEATLGKFFYVQTKGLTSIKGFSGEGNRFNSDIAGKLCVFCDEVSDYMNLEKDEAIKMAITSETLRVELKGKEPFHMDSFHRYIMASNKTNLYVPEDERRLVLFSIGDKYQGDVEFWVNFHESIKTEEFIRGLRSFLYSYEPKKGFHILHAPIITKEKLEAKRNSLTQYEKAFVEMAINGTAKSHKDTIGIKWELNRGLIITKEKARDIIVGNIRDNNSKSQIKNNWYEDGFGKIKKIINPRVYNVIFSDEGSKSDIDKVFMVFPTREYCLAMLHHKGVITIEGFEDDREIKDILDRTTKQNKDLLSKYHNKFKTRGVDLNKDSQYFTIVK